MNQPAFLVRERVRLVASNPMRIAGLQGVYGDPCGTELVPLSLSEALCLHLELGRNQELLTLIDAGSISPLFEVLSRFRESCPRAQLIVIGTDADDTYIECVISAGAKGFIPQPQRRKSSDRPSIAFAKAVSGRPERYSHGSSESV